jgi:hypothetical protein
MLSNRKSALLVSGAYDGIKHRIKCATTACTTIIKNGLDVLLFVLQVLDVSNNALQGVTSLNLFSLTSLRHLDLSNNPGPISGGGLSLQFFQRLGEAGVLRRLLLVNTGISRRHCLLAR